MVAAEDLEVVASEVAGTGHRSMEIMATTEDLIEVAGTDHQVKVPVNTAISKGYFKHTDRQADMADLEEATEVQEAATAALEEDSMEVMATVVAVVDTITTAAVTDKATAEEEAVSALEDEVVRIRDSCK